MKKLCVYKNLTLFFDKTAKKMFLVSKNDTDLENVLTNSLQFLKDFNISKIVLIFNNVDIDIKKEDIVEKLKNQYSAKKMCYDDIYCANYNKNKLYDSVNDDDEDCFML